MELISTEIIQLSSRDRQMLIEALSKDDEWEPGEELKELAKEYKEIVISK